MLLLSKYPVVLAAMLLAACDLVPKKNTSPKTETTQTKPDPLMELATRNQTTPKPVTVAPSNEAPFFNEAAPSVEQTGFLGNPNVQKFMEYQQHQGMSSGVLNDFFQRANHRANIIGIMDRPATSRPWYEFQKGNSGSAKIQAGKRFYQNNRAIIDRAAQQYGVPAEIIVAIIGIETNYGNNMGNIRVADSLATLAFNYPRRGAYFQKELAEFLQLAQEEKRDPFEFTGSFAGAMGMPQFMPSSFRKWAVDFDGDGRRDIWRNTADTAASVANYMKQHGWQTGGKIVVPVSLNITPELQAVIDEKTALKYTVSQLRQMGVTPLASVRDDEKAILFRLETSPNEYQYFIGLTNFYAIWKYNNSRMYVTAVRDIANGVSGGNL